MIRRPRALAAVPSLLVAAFAVVASAAGQPPAVGQVHDGATLLPDNQSVAPVGARTEMQNGRVISSALSPDGTKVAALTQNGFVGSGVTVVDVATNKVLQQIGMRGDTAGGSLGDGTVATDGPLYSPDGRTLWVSQATDLLRMTVNTDGTLVSTPAATIRVKATHGGPFGSGQAISAPVGDALPSGAALSKDGRQLYVALNGNNTLGVVDTRTNTLTRQIPVGLAPRQVVVSWPYAYVSDQGGRHLRKGETTNYSDYSRVVADPLTGAATTGAVSVVDLREQREVREIPVGLGPAAMLPDGRELLVVNTNGDSLSVIDTARQRLVRTLPVQPLPGVDVGSNVNALLRPDSTHLLLSLGRDNAIAVYHYASGGGLALQGLVPTDWYPVAVQRSAGQRGRIVVTSGKGRGGRGSALDSSAPDAGPRSTHLETSSVTVFPLPTGKALAADTARVRHLNGWDRFGHVNSGEGDTVPSVIPPQRAATSPITHIMLVVKENRTYDQVLGDLGQGNGDPSLAQFGAAVTPNHHALAQRFGTLDNFYDPATQSPDGHNWIVQANPDDYLEGSFGTFGRSYPASGSDALAYQRSGFLWDRALRAGLSVRNYGEFVNWISLPNSGAPTWADWYQDAKILEGKASGPLPVPITKYRSWTDVPALNAVTNPYFPLFDLDIPDQYRVDIWERDFKAALASKKLPNLTLMTLMSDHTATSAGPHGPPNPVSEVADNDLALGRIVSDVSQSPFWASTAIFVVEDDAQAGVDHVDGHRAPMLVISPYSKPGVHSTYWTQLNMTRTIEQILHLGPMTQGDANAEPMYGAFTAKPDLTPYTTQPNLVPLTLGSGSTDSGVGTPGFGQWQSLLDVPAAVRPVVDAWNAWGRWQHFGGSRPSPDVADAALLNHYGWYAAHSWRTPYPGEVGILSPAQLLQR